MSKRVEISVFSIVTLVVLANIIFKITTGKNIEFFEIMAMSVFSMFLLYALTWGNKEEKNGIFQDEELGKRITVIASKISYTILYFVIMIAVLADKIVNGTSNVFLLAVFVSAMIIFPLVQYLVSKKYK
ncbi:hypothetical protein BN997_02556 [Oceanobacillus oncorhynchi]|uniref:Group-specific protein n=1 Tax=Oceanobacillus oncorhynchi TaxID=545501 RepID=A0A0A1MUS5_9BACI|nr:hypothetical protein [Oceanobacillus oncorhynchi]CEI82671.1 hypothetical protein BN997_02556 [Oceanobacillus oncorhynchi]